MILIRILGIVMIAFGVYWLIIEKLIHKKHTVLVEAELVDEAEDSIYDNTGGTKIRFFKVFCYKDQGVDVIVRSTKPMRKITDTVGKKSIIYADTINRTAVEKGDRLKNDILSLLAIIFGIALIAATVWIKLNVKGAVW